MGWCGEAGCWENLWVGADRQGKAGAGISKKVGRCGEEGRGSGKMSRGAGYESVGDHCLAASCTLGR